MKKTHSNYRISEEGKQLLKRLTEKLGLTETSVIELAVRRLAEAEGVRNLPKN